MIGGLPFAYENGPVAPGRRIAPEWKVTLQTPQWQEAEQADQPAEASFQPRKIQYRQTLAEQKSPIKPHAEGAFNFPRSLRFKTPFRVNIQPRLSRDARAESLVVAFAGKCLGPCPPEAIP